MRRCIPLLMAAGCLAACGDDDGGPAHADAASPAIDAPSAPLDAGLPDANPFCHPVSGTPTLGLEDVAGAFNAPVMAVVPPGDRRIFVVEKSGRKISIIDEDGTILPTPFLDASNVVEANTVGSERGLLGLAFHPDFQLNRRFFIYYNTLADPVAGFAERDVVIAEYTASAADPDVADPTGTVLIHQPKMNNIHNGGWIAFGPDGMLYAALGEDGLHSPARNPTSLLGKVLRLDVSQPGSYSIPPDNPLAGMGGGVREEIWVSGLRNPWRPSFDRVTGDLYIADVGANAMEEIDVLPASAGGGLDFGWDVMEGSECLGGTPGCDMSGLTAPIYAYAHDAGEAAAVTGGYAYRGCDMPELAGTYFFTDVFRAWIRSFRWDGAGGITDLTDYPQFDGHMVFSFGEDADGEILVLDGSDGHVYRLVPM